MMNWVLGKFNNNNKKNSSLSPHLKLTLALFLKLKTKQKNKYRLKAKYAKLRGLAGVAIYSLNDDDPTNKCELEVNTLDQINLKLFISSTFEQQTKFV